MQGAAMNVIVVFVLGEDDIHCGP